MRLNHDLLNNSNRAEVSAASFKLLTRLQDTPSHIQVASTCCLFLLLCEHFKEPPEVIFRMAKNALAYDNDKATEEHFGAVRDYLKGEIK